MAAQQGNRNKDRTLAFVRNWWNQEDYEYNSHGDRYLRPDVLGPCLQNQPHLNKYCYDLIQELVNLKVHLYLERMYKVELIRINRTRCEEIKEAEKLYTDFEKEWKKNKRLVKPILDVIEKAAKQDNAILLYNVLARAWQSLDPKDKPIIEKDMEKLIAVNFALECAEVAKADGKLNNFEWEFMKWAPIVVD